MIVGLFILLICIILGALTGLNITIPYSYSQYVAVAILACLDSVLGAFLASTEKKFKITTFLSGFFGNALIAIFFVYLSYKLNVDIYIAAIVVFGGRLLNNFSSLRRDAMDNLDKKGKTIKSGKSINYKKKIKKIDEIQKDL
jgi:small basic protein